MGWGGKGIEFQKTLRNIRTPSNAKSWSSLWKVVFRSISRWEFSLKDKKQIYLKKNISFPCFYHSSKHGKKNPELCLLTLGGRLRAMNKQNKNIFSFFISVRFFFLVVDKSLYVFSDNMPLVIYLHSLFVFIRFLVNLKI